MKFSWGHGITAFIVGFILFMGFLVYQAVSVQFDLVAEDYYAQELAYQDKLDQMANLANAETQPEIIMETGTLKVILTEGSTLSSGIIKLYSPASMSGDREASWTNTSGPVAIETNGMTPGWYELQVSWETDGVKYYFEQEVEVK